MSLCHPALESCRERGKALAWREERGREKVRKRRKQGRAEGRWGGRLTGEEGAEGSQTGGRPRWGC